MCLGNLLSLLRRHGLMAASLAAVLIGLRWGGTGFTGGWSQLADGLRAMLGIVAQMFPPNFGYFGRISGELSEGLLITLLSTAIAAGAVIISGWVRASVSQPLGVSRVIQICLRGVGAVHAVVWALVLVRGLGAGPVSGLAALTLSSLGLFAADYPSATATPHAPPTLSALLDRSLSCLESNIRLSVVLGLVGAGGIGELLYANIQFQLWPNVGVILGGILGLVLTVDALCGQWRRRLAVQSLTSQQARQRAS